MIVIKFKSFLEKPYYAVHNFCIKKNPNLPILSAIESKKIH